MRVLAAAVVLAALSAGPGHASSFVTLPAAHGDTPSVVFAGPAGAAPSISSIQPGPATGAGTSIVALGQPEPALVDDHVAAIPRPGAKPAAAHQPMVIRGGRVDDGNPPAPKQSAAQPEPAPEPSAAPQPKIDGGPDQPATSAPPPAETATQAPQ